MNTTVKTLLVSATLLFSSISQAGLITDVVNQDVYVNWFDSYSYSHDLTEATDDPFTLGSALSADLSINIYDDSSSFWDGGELILVTVEAFDFDSGGLTFSSFIGDLEVNGLLALNTNGLLDVTVSSLWGDFRLGDSTLTVVTADAAVPEPSIIALFGMGLLGLGLARRKVRS